MLEETPDDADDANAVGEALDLRPQAADAAHDEVDFHAGLRREIQRVDDLRVHERVHLRDDARGPPRRRVLGLPLDELQEPLPHAVRRDDQLAIHPLAREPRQHVEQVADVRAHGLAAGEQADVGVDARGLGVVVAGAEVHVSPDAVRLAPHDERDLRMRLESLNAVGDVHAERLQRAREVDVVRLLEPRLQLDEHGHLDAALRGFRQRTHDGAASRAVQRHLDGERLVVARGGLDELLDRRAERIERMVHEHVALANRVEDRAAGVAQLGRHGRDERRVLELRQVEQGERHEVAQVEQRARRVHLAVRERRDLGIFGVAQLVEQQRAQCGGHVGRHLESHHFAEPALEHLLLDHREEVFRLLAVRDLEVRIARDAERVRAEDLHPREQRAEMRADHLLERHEVIRAALDGNPAWEGLRHLHAGEMLVAVFGLAKLHRQREREVRDVRERMARIDRERRQHGEYVRLEERVHRLALGGGELRHRQQAHAVRAQRGQQQLVQAAARLLQQVADAALDRVELLPCGEPVGRRLLHARRHLPAQAGNAHHVELVEVRAEDREELQPFEQRVTLVERLRQHARVELEPRELAVQEVRRRCGRIRGSHG